MGFCGGFQGETQSPIIAGGIKMTDQEFEKFAEQLVASQKEKLQLRARQGRGVTSAAAQGILDSLKVDLHKQWEDIKRKSG